MSKSNHSDSDWRQCKKDCENILTIETQEGDKHAGTKKIIKSETRTLQTTPISGATKHKSIKKYLKHKKQHAKILDNGYEMIDGKKVICNTKALRDKMRKQKIHKNRMGTSKTVMDKGKVIRCAVKEIRIAGRISIIAWGKVDMKGKKNFHSKTFGSYNKKQKCVGGGTNRLERYRIPPKLIEDIFKNL